MKKKPEISVEVAINLAKRDKRSTWRKIIDRFIGEKTRTYAECAGIESVTKSHGLNRAGTKLPTGPRSSNRS